MLLNAKDLGDCQKLFRLRCGRQSFERDRVESRRGVLQRPARRGQQTPTATTVNSVNGEHVSSHTIYPSNEMNTENVCETQVALVARGINGLLCSGDTHERPFFCYMCIQEDLKSLPHFLTIRKEGTAAKRRQVLGARGAGRNGRNERGRRGRVEAAHGGGRCVYSGGTRRPSFFGTRSRSDPRCQTSPFVSPCL